MCIIRATLSIFQGTFFVVFLQELITAGCKTIKLQNLLFLWGVGVKVNVELGFDVREGGWGYQNWTSANMVESKVWAFCDNVIIEHPLNIILLWISSCLSYFREKKFQRVNQLGQKKKVNKEVWKENFRKLN